MYTCTYACICTCMCTHVYMHARAMPMQRTQMITLRMHYIGICFSAFLIEALMHRCITKTRSKHGTL